MNPRRAGLNEDTGREQINEDLLLTGHGPGLVQMIEERLRVSQKLASNR